MDNFKKCFICNSSNVKTYYIANDELELYEVIHLNAIPTIGSDYYVVFSSTVIVEECESCGAVYSI